MQKQTMKPGNRRSRLAGVTLIELMIVVTILGTLTAIAVPAYRGYSERAQRTEGKSALLRLATQQDRWYLTNNTYTNDLTALGFPAGCSENCVYTIDFTVAPDTVGWTARARPTAGGGTNNVDQTRDTACSWFTLSSTGARNAENTDCW